MELPDDIEKEILRYLHLEYGENPASPDSLKLDEIVPYGVLNIVGVDTYYFKYGRTKWATVTVNGNFHNIGMTEDPPEHIFKSSQYDQLFIKQLGYKKILTTQLEKWDPSMRGFVNLKDIKLQNGSTIQVRIEVNPKSSPPHIFIRVIDGEIDISARSYVSIDLEYKSENVAPIWLKIGP